MKPRRFFLTIAAFALSLYASDEQRIRVKTISVETGTVRVNADLQGKPTELFCQIRSSSCSRPQPGDYTMRPAAVGESIYEDCTNVVLLKASSANQEKIGVYCWLNANDCYLVRCSNALVETVPASVKGSLLAQSPSQPSSRIQIPSAEMGKLLVKRIPPEYPEKARRQGIQGTVMLRAIVSKQGDVIDVSVISGDAELSKAAIKAAKKWKYRPYLLGGEAAEVETTIQMNFQLAR